MMTTDVEQRRQDAINSLAAALVKSSGGDIKRPEQWNPALLAAGNTVDAIAEFALAQQRARATSMGEVVQQLRAEQSEALFDLIEFDHALEEILKNLVFLATSSSDVHEASRKISMPDTDERLPSVRTLQEYARQLSIRTAETLLDFCKLRRAAFHWGIGPGVHNEAASHHHSAPERESK
jgi:hypothetical protein